jgi:hypothetical protein
MTVLSPVRPRAGILAIVVVTALVWAGAADAGSSDRSAARRGAAWLTRAVGPGSDGQAADTAVALRAAGLLGATDRRRRAAALARGTGTYDRTAGAISKTILGLVALRAPARCVSGVDLRTMLGRTYHGGRYGRSAFDQALALLALRALHVRAPTPAVRALIASRGAGGWNFTLSRTGADDASTTGLVLSALRASGVPAAHPAIRGALRWLAGQRTANGGFAFGRRDRTEADSTAIALVGERAAGMHDRRAAQALRGLQRPGGAFQYTSTDAGSRELATIDAVTALSGVTLPVARLHHRARGCR